MRPEELLSAARAIACEIAENTAPVSLVLACQMLWKLLRADHPMEAHRLDLKEMFWTGRSADTYEGVSGFLTKCPPRFHLRPS